MRSFVLAIVPLALLLPFAPLAPASGADGARSVEVFDFGYADADTGTLVTLAAVGEPVTWTWRAGSLPHSVTHGAQPLVDGAAGGAFDSGILGSGDYTHTFDAPGVYVYYCKLHAAMRGVVVVQ